MHNSQPCICTCLWNITLAFPNIDYAFRLEYLNRRTSCPPFAFALCCWWCQTRGMSERDIVDLFDHLQCTAYFRSFLAARMKSWTIQYFFLLRISAFMLYILQRLSNPLSTVVEFKRQFQIFWERRQFPFTAYLLQRFAPVEPAIVFRTRIIKSCRSKNAQLSAIYCPRKLLFQHFCLMFIVVPELHWTNIFSCFYEYSQTSMEN